MKGNLYVITNTINDKKYVGKTYLDIESRMKHHYYDRNKLKNRPLYRAINKYGFDKFIIEFVSSFEEYELEEAEQKLIASLDTYNNGYNATLGGDGTRYISIPDETIIAEYEINSNCSEVSRILGLHYETVSKILKANGIKVLTSGEVTKLSFKSYPVNCLTLNIVKNSIEEMAHYLIDNNIAKNSLKVTKEGIRRVIKGTRNSYLKMKFTEG